jgi:hypothetical protein
MISLFNCQMGLIVFKIFRVTDNVADTSTILVCGAVCQALFQRYTVGVANPKRVDPLLVHYWAFVE